MYEYLALSHNNPAALVDKINKAATEGWRLVVALSDKNVILERQA